MSQPKVKGKPLADKRNVLSVFAKHYKSQVSTPVPISNATACCSSCSHADGPGALHSNVPVKEKRLKTRKERDHRRQRCGGQKIKSHPHSKPSCREKELCQGPCQPQSLSKYCEKFAKAFAPKEPSFITERRLIGHQGLFNHEVKSFDIERLLSEERRIERSKKQGNDANKITLSPTQQNSSDDKKCPSTHKDEVSRTCSIQGVLPETETANIAQSQACLQSEDSSANNQGSRPSLSQRKTEVMDLSPFESNSVIVLSSSPKSTESNNMPQLTPRISEGECNFLKSHSAECHIQPEASNANTQNSEYTPASLKIPAPYAKMQKPSSTPDTPAAKDVDQSSASLDQKAKSGTERTQTEAKVARHLISVVADHLCQSLDQPLLLRRHLVADSRATLLHMLQEKHGTLLRQNLLKLHTTLGFGQTQPDNRCDADTHSEASEDQWTAAVGSVQGSSSRPDPVQQSWLDPRQKPINKRRRKQRRPQRRTPPSPPSPHGHLNESLRDTDLRTTQGLPWTLNMATEQEVLMEPANPTSDPFLMGGQTTDTLLTDGSIFSSKWGSHPGLPQSCDKPPSWEEIQAISSSYGNWKYDPDLPFTCQTGYLGQHKHPFSSYRMVPQGGALREPQCLSVDQPFEFEKHLMSACSPDTRHGDLKSFQLQPYYRSHQPLPSASSSITSYRPDMNFYPPSELLEMALSPPKHPSASPEGWSYPRMRLY